MFVQSSYSCASNPFRAGLQLGEALAGIAPEVVFLFSATLYEGSPELLEGLLEALDQPDVKVVGCSGDGIYAGQGAADHGVTALGIQTAGQVTWHVCTRTGIGAAPEATVRALLADAESAFADGSPDLGFLYSDFRTDASGIEAAIGQASFPIIGGFSADDNRMQRCFLYAGAEVLADAAVLLTLRGPLPFRIFIGNTLEEIGQPGIIDEVEGKNVLRVSGMPAMDFFEQETGKPVLHSDRGINCLSIVDPDAPNVRRLRSIVPEFSRGEGHIGLYGGIERGREVRVCLARPEQLIAEIHQIAERAAAEGFRPRAALIVSCAGRKGLLQEAIGQEVSALRDRFGSELQICGFPSFGEIGPLRDPETGAYSRNLFHNMTYVLCLLGEPGTGAPE